MTVLRLKMRFAKSRLKRFSQRTRQFLLGHDRFHPDMVEEHLGPLRDQLGLSYEQLLSLGRIDPQDSDELFCMTVIGLKAIANRECSESVARMCFTAHVVTSLAVAGRRRLSDWPHYQWCAFANVVSASDESAV